MANPTHITHADVFVGQLVEFLLQMGGHPVGQPRIDHFFQFLDGRRNGRSSKGMEGIRMTMAKHLVFEEPATASVAVMATGV